MVIAAPPVPPARDRRGQFVHDGFYLRLGVGLGGGQGRISSDDAPSFKFGGGGLALNLWIGGTPWRGIALGGLFTLQGMEDTNTVVEGDETDQEVQGALAQLGVFIDAFPDPQRGLHLGGSLGLAALNAKGESKALEDRYGVKDYDGGGLGVSGWIGYMGFVGPEWSLGGLLQLSGVATRQDKDDVERRGSGWALNASFTALYH